MSQHPNLDCAAPPALTMPNPLPADTHRRAIQLGNPQAWISTLILSVQAAPLKDGTDDMDWLLGAEDLREDTYERSEDKAQRKVWFKQWSEVKSRILQALPDWLQRIPSVAEALSISIGRPFDLVRFLECLGTLLGQIQATKSDWDTDVFGPVAGRGAVWTRPEPENLTNRPRRATATRRPSPDLSSFSTRLARNTDWTEVSQGFSIDEIINSWNTLPNKGCPRCGGDCRTTTTCTVATMDVDKNKPREERRPVRWKRFELGAGKPLTVQDHGHDEDLEVCAKYTFSGETNCSGKCGNSHICTLCLGTSHWGRICPIFKKRWMQEAVGMLRGQEIY